MSAGKAHGNGEDFYDNAKKYWSDIPATVQGMLGGFSHISSTDIAGSAKFVRQFLKLGKEPKGQTGTELALDCGAGIGRITKRLLIPLFEKVDMVELNQNFLNESKNYMGEYESKIGKRICSGLQDFTPPPKHYDLIWCQWVLGHLTDDDLVVFFKKCKEGLRENGIIVCKENICPPGQPDFDDRDSSFTRPRESLVSIMHKADLKIVKEDKQNNFPKEIYDVRMFALQ